jgi:hypothetical protein
MPLYGAEVSSNYLIIVYNQILSMDDAYAFETKLISNGFNGISWIEYNGMLDTDEDGITDSDDNCIDNCNTQQLGADDDGEGVMFAIQMIQDV